MCGIGGWAGGPVPDPGRLCGRLKDGLAHRGPDAAGDWVEADGGAGLAHTRLAIIDLDPRSNQPLSFQNRWQIAYNGEIYNYRELRRDLEAEGTRFRTESDTEVILAGYERWGDGVFEKLRGMYALAIWDRNTREMVLARDPLGIKPLYYSAVGSRLLFASELRALIATGLVERVPDAGAIHHYLCWGSFQQPGTPLRDVRCLEAGARLRWRDGMFSIHRPPPSWWPEPDERGPSDPSALRAAIEESVSAHLVSDVPVGIFLSAGLDSGILALVVSRLRENGGGSAFTLGFPGTGLDEIPGARAWAGTLGIPHTAWTPSEADIATLARNFFEGMDQPGIDGFNTYCISSLAAREGYKVVLSGLGGDELLGGYPSFRRLPAMMRWHSGLKRIPGLARGLRQAARLTGDGRWARLGEWIGQPLTWGNAHAAYRGIFTPEEAGHIMAQLGHTGSGAVSPPDEDAPGPGADADQVAYLEITRYMRNQLLRDGDAYSMACGIELRLPLVDTRLYRQVLAMDPDWRCRAGKRALLEAFPEIPDWLAHRKKTGFTLPYDHWFKDALAPWAGSIPSRLAPYMTSWYRRMCLLSLIQWQKVNLGGA